MRYYLFDWNSLPHSLFPDARSLEKRLEEIRRVLRERPERKVVSAKGWVGGICPLCGEEALVTNAPEVGKVRPQDWLYICERCMAALAYKGLVDLLGEEKEEA